MSRAPSGCVPKHFCLALAALGLRRWEVGFDRNPFDLGAHLIALPRPPDPLLIVLAQQLEPGRHAGRLQPVPLNGEFARALRVKIQEPLLPVRSEPGQSRVVRGAVSGEFDFQQAHGVRRRLQPGVEFLPFPFEADSLFRGLGLFGSLLCSLAFGSALFLPLLGEAGTEFDGVRDTAELRQVGARGGEFGCVLVTRCLVFVERNPASSARMRSPSVTAISAAAKSSGVTGTISPICRRSASSALPRQRVAAWTRPETSSNRSNPMMPLRTAMRSSRPAENSLSASP